jgi:N-acetylglutamate synthase-like GNAT family acetyltransferase
MKEGPMWIALLDTEVVGTVAAVKKSDSLYMRGMGVLPRARGSRIGEALVDAVVSYASSEGCTRLFLSTTPFLHRAIRLYEKCGFTRTDEAPYDLHGTPLFTMERIL